MVTSAMLPAATRRVNQAVTRLINIATLLPGSPFHGAHPDSLTMAQGRIQTKNGAQQAKVIGAAYHSGGDLTANGAAFRRSPAPG